MIKLIVGSKGAGKTKKIIDYANSVVAPCTNEIAFITDTTRYRLDIKHGVRFVDSTDFGGIIVDGASLLSFLGGLFSANNDMTAIFIDGIARIAKAEVKDLADFFEKAEKLAESQHATLVFTISLEESDLPEFLLKHEKICPIRNS